MMQPADVLLQFDINLVLACLLFTTAGVGENQWLR
jgi:hypothetical protein